MITDREVVLIKQFLVRCLDYVEIGSLCLLYIPLRCLSAAAGAWSGWADRIRRQ